MACSPKGSSVVKVHRECVVAKALEGLIVVAVHVAHEEVEDGQVDQIKQSTTLVIRVNVSNNITVVGVRFPLSFSTLVVAATPRVSPSFPWRKIFGRKKRGKTALEHVGAAADGVRGVAVVRALAVEAEVACRGDEECLQEVALCQRVDLPRDVQGPPGHRDGATKAEQPVEVEGGDLGVVALEVREVKVVWQRLLAAREPHRLEQGLSSILELDDQLQLGASLLLADADDGQGLHGGDRVPDRLSVRGVHLLLPHPKLELLPHGL